jgi:hypothetical protein
MASAFVFFGVAALIADFANYRLGISPKAAALVLGFLATPAAIFVAATFFEALVTRIHVALDRR